MCGIIGSYPASNISLRHIMHRGPDANGTVSLADISVGHSRLSILDLTNRSRQPKWSADHSVLLSYNGEIYNFTAICLDAQGSDTVALVEWLSKEGSSFDPSCLDGMYAFAAYFNEEKKLVLCRDPAGIKPLYIAISNDGEFLAFSSEIKGFLGIEWFVPYPNDSEAVQQDFLQYGYSFQQKVRVNYRNHAIELPLVPTLLKNVYQVCPGQKIIFSLNQLPVFSFSKLDRKEGDPLKFLTQSIEDQSIADVEVGVQLSGGIDSSLVAYEYALQHELVHGFYVSVQDEALCEDRWVSIAVNELCKITNFNFHNISASYEEAKRVLPYVAWYMDEPVIRHPNAIGVYLLCEYVRKQTMVKVLLTGEGADEIFGGYSWHDGKKMEEFDKSRRLFDFGGSPVVDDYLSKYPGQPVLERQLLYDRAVYLPPILARQDRMSMAHSIETRVPFLSNRFLGMPSPSMPGKTALKEKARKIFGDEFTHRPKGGFGFPWKWLGDFKSPDGTLDWLIKQPKPKNEMERWTLTAIGLWSEKYLYGGWRNIKYTDHKPESGFELISRRSILDKFRDMMAFRKEQRN